MFLQEIQLLVTCFLISVTIAIRVDWGTNTGPIVPSPPRTTRSPQPPFREPAPVWEDQSDDIPNPNPYTYVLPPPSRPRPAYNNYLTVDRRPLSQEEYHNINNVNKKNNFGHVLSPSELNAYINNRNGQSALVPSLAAKYVPNEGTKYAAVVLNNGAKNSKYPTSPIGNTNVLSSAYYDTNANNNNKLQAKYNAKTKKYKAYEKFKFVPLNYYPLFNYGEADQADYVPEFDQAEYVPELDEQQYWHVQQLPLQTDSQIFNPNEGNNEEQHLEKSLSQQQQQQQENEHRTPNELRSEEKTQQNQNQQKTQNDNSKYLGKSTEEFHKKTKNSKDFHKNNLR